jgi:hypothetical protein
MREHAVLAGIGMTPCVRVFDAVGQLRHRAP